MRHLRVAIALTIVWLLVLAWAAGVPWSAPLFPPTTIALSGQDFRPVMGAGVEDGTALGVGAITSDGNAMQTTALEHLHAADSPILHYEFDDFPRTLELSLVFRRADAPNDVQVVLLPWPGDAAPSVDLSVLPAWHGEIVELGFAEYATAQLVPPSIAFRPFRLVRAELSAPAWSALPALLRTDWFGYQPWSLLSISALGPSINALSTPTMLAPAILGALLSWGVLAWLCAASPAILVRRAVVFAAVTWVLLDLRWIDDLTAKHKLTASVYAGKSWQERARLQADEDVIGFAQLTRQHLADKDGSARVLVASDSVYTMLRLIYFLLPLNAVPLDGAHSAMPLSAWPKNAVIVICAGKSWRYESTDSTLHFGAQSLPVTPLFIGGELGVYRLRGAGS